MNLEEFVNPKSMVTPGFAAAIVATVAGALFSMFGLALPLALIALSFFVGAVVFLSREFADPQMRSIAKGFLYVLNSLIIFAMATGNHSLLDQRGRTGSPPRVSVVGSAYAQETHSEKIPVLKQERPFFYDWTKATAAHAGMDDKGIIRFEATKDFGKFKAIFIDAGVMTPDYKVRVGINQSKLPGEVKSVTWYLPAAYFVHDKVKTADTSRDFAISIDAWKPFVAGAEIELTSGEKFRIEKLVGFTGASE